MIPNTSSSPSAKVSLPFYLVGALYFVVLSTLLLLNPEVFLGHYFTPKLLALVHLAVLGWGTMIIFGAAHQLLPVLCGRALYSERLALCSLLLLTVGTAILACHFWQFSEGYGLILGGSLVCASVICYVINVFGTAFKKATSSPHQLFLLASASYLLITVVAGLLLAINLFFPYIETNHLEFLKLHAHAGLAGWFLLLIMGVTTKLIPMFLLAKSDRTSLLYSSFILVNLGLLLFLVDAFFFGFTARTHLYYFLILLGIVLWLVFLYDNYQNRLRRRIEPLMKQSALSFAFLFISLGLALVLLIKPSMTASILYGTLLIMGWITTLIFGQTFKTMPFIVWNARYSKLSGKQKVPLPGALYNLRFVKLQSLFHILALLLLIIGISIKSEPLIRVALLSWLLCALLYLGNVLKVSQSLIKRN